MSFRTLALVGLVVLAALTRLLPHPPNFAPITAIAVFGALRFGQLRAAVGVPLLALLVSDLAHEFLYRNGLDRDWGLYKGMGVNYATTALIALMAGFAHGTRSPVKIAATTLAGSCVFFLVTNFGFWVMQPLEPPQFYYPMTAAGLAECYVAALPFFRNALLGDMTYAVILFGAWAVAENRIPALRPAPLPATP
jgi:hypothetical protein